MRNSRSSCASAARWTDGGSHPNADTRQRGPRRYEHHVFRSSTYTNRTGVSAPTRWTNNTRVSRHCGELHCWAIKFQWGPTRHTQLRQFLDNFLIVPLSKGMVEIAAQVKADRQRAGRTMETADVWIAATALYLKVPLVTHDEDFADTPGLRIITASPSVSAVRANLPVNIRPDLLLDMRCRCSL